MYVCRHIRMCLNTCVSMCVCVCVCVYVHISEKHVILKMHVYWAYTHTHVYIYVHTYQHRLVGASDSDWEGIMDVVACVLHIGNVMFAADTVSGGSSDVDKATIEADTKAYLDIGAYMRACIFTCTCACMYVYVYIYTASRTRMHHHRRFSLGLASFKI
jgi:hypothetical protein